MADRQSEAFGFGLVEALVATCLFAVAAASLAPVLLRTQAAVVLARDQSMTALLAAAKLAELESLDWGYRAGLDGTLTAVSDTTTDLATTPPGAAGAGLGASPPGVLLTNTAGYVDFLDADGRWVGTGSRPSPAARYVRRWAVTPWSGDPGDTLVLQVMAATVRAELADGPRIDARRRPGDTWLLTVRTRVRP